MKRRGGYWIDATRAAEAHCRERGDGPVMLWYRVVVRHMERRGGGGGLSTSPYVKQTLGADDVAFPSQSRCYRRQWLWRGGGDGRVLEEVIPWDENPAASSMAKCAEEQGAGIGHLAREYGCVRRRRGSKTPESTRCNSFSTFIAVNIIIINK